MNNLKIHSINDSELRVENYMILFGGEDLAGEFFTKNTRFDSTYTDLGVLYVDFEHGFDSKNRNIHDSVMGVVDWKSAKIDEKGIFVQRVLNRRSKYVEYLADLIEAGIIGTSSEAVAADVVRKSTGEIIQWPLMRDTLTATPMEPRMIGENILVAAKSLSEILPDSKTLKSLLGEELEEEPTIEQITDLKSAERYLRDSGLSRSAAVAFMARVKHLGQSDSDGGLEHIVEMAITMKKRLTL